MLERVTLPLVASVIMSLAFIPDVAAQTAAPPTSGLRIDGIPLPARYLGDRFYVAPETTAGDTLLFYTDTGGGVCMLYRAAATTLQLALEPLVGADDSTLVVALPPMKPGSAIPPPNLLPPFGDRLLVSDPPPGSHVSGTGFLGRTWFAGRAWELDYPNRFLGLVTAYDARAVPAAHVVELGFQTDSGGRRTTHFPRIQIAVAEDSLDLLFDTGATVQLSDEVLSVLHDGGEAERATSFVTVTLFLRWRAAHPSWHVIEHADAMLDMPMIEVPTIGVAGYEVGPVWFTARPDRSFTEYMSQWMDRPIVGALGGSALRYFRVLVDYPAGVAIFERP